MVGRLFTAEAALALILRVGGANAEPQSEPILVPPVSPACISSPFGPRVLANHPQAGTYHRGVDLPAPPGASIVATAPGKVIRIQKKGPGGLEILVQHDGFVAIYSHLDIWPSAGSNFVLGVELPSREHGRKRPNHGGMQHENRRHFDQRFDQRKLSNRLI